MSCVWVDDFGQLHAQCLPTKAYCTISIAQICFPFIPVAEFKVDLSKTPVEAYCQTFIGKIFREIQLFRLI